MSNNTKVLLGAGVVFLAGLGVGVVPNLASSSDEPADESQSETSDLLELMDLMELEDSDDEEPAPRPRVVTRPAAGGKQPSQPSGGLTVILRNSGNSESPEEGSGDSEDTGDTTSTPDEPAPGSGDSTPPGGSGGSGGSGDSGPPYEPSRPGDPGHGSPPGGSLCWNGSSYESC